MTIFNDACSVEMLPISSSSIFVNKNSFNVLLTHFRRKMAQLCLWTKIRTKQWLILGESAFQCKRAGFLRAKCDNFACLHTRQDQNQLHLERWFFLPKSASSVSRSQAYFPALFKRLHNHIRSKTNYLSNHTEKLSVTIYEISTNRKKALDGGPYI